MTTSAVDSGIAGTVSVHSDLSAAISSSDQEGSASKQGKESEKAEDGFDDTGTLISKVLLCCHKHFHAFIPNHMQLLNKSDTLSEEGNGLSRLYLKLVSQIFIQRRLKTGAFLL